MADSPECPQEPDADPTEITRNRPLPRAASGSETSTQASNDELPLAAPVPETLGELVIERELARGGMGVVFAARHPQLGRRVAVKLMQLDAPEGDPRRERFAIEARAAARLRHPNIVGIHSVGEADGRPYLVMDLIEGPSLKDIVQEQGRLAPREAAQLCLQLANALAYAHRHAILHRDLKPANILLDPEGAPIITDFGLAKEVKAPEEHGLTHSGQIMGTPAYMPPEQADGRLEAVDRRADIYSLGATLYELLTGQPPFSGPTVMNILHAVLTHEPQAPRKLAPHLDADLETICLKCLEKEPGARYDSAQRLADDLQRYLAGEPIAARRASPGERAVKWLRRNRRLATSLAATVVIALLVIAGLSARFVLQLREVNDNLRVQADTLNARGLELQRERAEVTRQLERANHQYILVLESFNTLVHGVNDELGDVPGAHIRGFRKRILDTVLVQLTRLQTTEGARSGIAMHRTATLSLLGQLALAAGRTDAAAEALSGAVHSARRLVAGDASSDNRRLLAGALRKLGSIKDQQGDLDAARRCLREALELCRALASQSLDADRELAQTLDGFANVLRKQGDMAAAFAAYDEGLEVSQRLATQNPENSGLQLLLASHLEAVGWARLNQGQLTAALRSASAALELYRAIPLDGVPSVSVPSELSRCLNLSAEIHRQLGSLQAASQAIDEGLQLREALVAHDPSSAGARRQLVVSLGYQADLCIQQGLLEPAAAAYARALQAIRALVALDPGSARDAQQLAAILRADGALRVRLGMLEQAQDSFGEALRISTQLVHQDPSSADMRRDLCSDLERLGAALQELGDIEAAFKCFSQALVTSRELAEADSTSVNARRNLFVALDKLSQVQELQGDHARALRGYNEQLEICRALLARAPLSSRARRDLSVALERLGDFFRGQADPHTALPFLEESRVLREELVARDPADLTARRDLGYAWAKIGEARRDVWDLEGAVEASEAALLLRRGLAASAPQDAALQSELAVALSLVAELYHWQRQLDHARGLLEETVRIRRGLVELDSTHVTIRQELAISLGMLGELRAKLRDQEGAINITLEAVTLLEDLAARAPGNPELRMDLVETRWQLGIAYQGVAQYPAALSQLREARGGFEALAGRFPELEWRLLDVSRDILQTELLAGERQARSPAEFLELGYAHYRCGAYQASVAGFLIALESEELAAELERPNLYNAACAAALASTSAEATEAEALRAQSLRWLQEDLERRRALVRMLHGRPHRSPEETQAIEAELRFQQDHLEHARERDPDLAVLRPLPAFQALFEE